MHQVHRTEFLVFRTFYRIGLSQIEVKWQYTYQRYLQKQFSSKFPLKFTPLDFQFYPLPFLKNLIVSLENIGLFKFLTLLDTST